MASLSFMYVSGVPITSYVNGQNMDVEEISKYAPNVFGVHRFF